VKGPWHRLSRVHRDILIFTSSALKTWVLHVNTFYSWILLYISPVTAVNISILSVPLYITHLLQLYQDTHVSLCTNCWLEEFGDVSCLQFNYLRVETLTPTWEDLVGHLSDNFKSEVRQNSVSDLSVWSLIHLEGSVHRNIHIWHLYIWNRLYNFMVSKPFVFFVYLTDW
jgi:hypothetical protein